LGYVSTSCIIIIIKADLYLQGVLNMTEDNVNRHIGVIAPNETKNQKFYSDYAKVIRPCWSIIPNTFFYPLSFDKLINVASRGVRYDIVIAARMKDTVNPEMNNIYTSSTMVRNRFNLDTIFVISFNEFLSKMSGLDPDAEKVYLNKLVEDENDPAKQSIGGIATTSSTDPNFIITIVADILDAPYRYLEKKQVHKIENQSHFFNHPPGDTLYGLSQ
jgi:hypothetical protein